MHKNYPTCLGSCLHLPKLLHMLLICHKRDAGRLQVMS